MKKLTWILFLTSAYLCAQSAFAVATDDHDHDLDHDEAGEHEEGHDHDHEHEEKKATPTERLGITDDSKPAAAQSPTPAAPPPPPVTTAVKKVKKIKPEDMPPPPEPGFEIETNLVQKIYEEQTEETVLSSLFKSPKMTAQVSLINIDVMELKNDYFTVDYKSAKSALPIFFAQIAPISVDWQRLNVALNISTGYSYRDEIYNVTSKRGVKVRDTISLQWLPISAAVKTQYKLPLSITPYLSLGAGNQFIRQSGTLDGISQSYWIPFTHSSAGVSWMDRSTIKGGGFSGVSTGLSYLSSFEDEQVVKYWTLDLGVNFTM